MANACEEILELAGNRQGDDVDRVTALAVERLLLIVGEATTRIRDDEPTVFDSIPGAAQLVGMRNVIVHGYDVIDWGRIRDAISDDLPKVLTFVRGLLNEGQ